MEIEKQITIFYSWQSDLPKQTNLNAIRQSIRSATNSVEDQIDDVVFKLDEATRNVPGSPNIPMTIFEKITKSDIFICDLTTINTDATDIQRKTPNPNVLIELGFAISQLGWHRIIMLFNTTFGEFSDLPFDIDRHRASQYKICDKNDKNGKGGLTSLLKIAIASIVSENPLKPSENNELTPKEKKRNRDLKNIKLILTAFHSKTFDTFLEEMPAIIINEIFYYKDLFIEIYDSSEFHIYDKKTKTILDNIKKYWNKSLSFYQHYDKQHNGNDYKFYTPMDVFESEKSQTDFYVILDTVRLLRKEYEKLLEYLRKEYLEIDLKNESDIAYEKYIIETKH
ncbi:MAG: hypothetical protein COA67_05640 [Lutibacter sp.]|nr:MAG: hypothetical protein COA67_05640 [Lutibacter sp.]